MATEASVGDDCRDAADHISAVLAKLVEVEIDIKSEACAIICHPFQEMSTLSRILTISSLCECNIEEQYTELSILASADLDMFPVDLSYLESILTTRMIMNHGYLFQHGFSFGKSPDGKMDTLSSMGPKHSVTNVACLSTDGSPQQKQSTVRKHLLANYQHCCNTLLRLILLTHSSDCNWKPRYLPSICTDVVASLFGLHTSNTHQAYRENDFDRSLMATNWDVAVMPTMGELYTRIKLAIDSSIKRSPSAGGGRKCAITRHDAVQWAVAMRQSQPNTNHEPNVGKSNKLHHSSNSKKKRARLTNPDFDSNRMKKANRKSALYHDKDKDNDTDTIATSNPITKPTKYYPYYDVSLPEYDENDPSTHVNPDMFLEPIEYVRNDVTKKWVEKLEEIFTPGNLVEGIRIGPNAKLEVHYLDVGRDGYSAPLWVVKNPLAEEEYTNLRINENKVTYLASSNEIGSYKKPKKRFYCAASKFGGGPFKISSDKQPMLIRQFQGVEERFANLANHCGFSYDDIIADTFKGKYFVHWVGDKTGVVKNCGTTIDSAYSDHDDAEYHHCVNLDSYDVVNSDMREFFLSLPPKILMRVFSLVDCDVELEGVHVADIVVKDRSGKIVKRIPLVGRVIHGQPPTMQEMFTHGVYIVLKQGVSLANGYRFIIRCILSYRNTLDHRDSHLIPTYEKFSKDYPLKKPYYNDYNVSGVWDHLSKGAPLVRGNHVITGSDFTGTETNASAHSNCNPPEQEKEHVETWCGHLVQSITAQRSAFVRHRLRIAFDKSMTAPMETSTRFVRDKMTLGERIRTRAFTDVLRKNSLDVFLSLYPNKSSSKRSNRKTSMDCAPVTVTHGVEPEIEVISHWDASCNLDTGDKTPFQVSEGVQRKKLEAGDVVYLDNVRQMNGYSSTEICNPICRTDDPRLVNHAIFSQIYKNDWKTIKEIQRRLRQGINVDDLAFFGCGAGGSSTNTGDKPINTKSVFADIPPPQVSPPADQEPTNPFNHVLLVCARVGCVVMIFTRPDQYPTNFKEDRPEVYGRYIGQYEMVGYRYQPDTIQDISESVPGFTGMTTEDKKLYTFRLMKYFRFRFKKYNQPQVEQHGELLPGSLKINLDGKLAKSRITAMYDTGSQGFDIMSTIVGPLQTGEIFASVFEKRYLPELLYNSHCNDYKPDDDGNCYIPSAGKESPLPAPLVQRKRDEENKDIEGNILGECGKVNIRCQQFYHMMRRVHVAAAYRFKGKHFTGIGREKCGYLVQRSTMQNLGEVLQSCPFPAPVSTYDQSSLLFVQLVSSELEMRPKANARAKPLPTRHKKAVERLCVSSIALCDLEAIFLTAIMVALFGKPEHMKIYLTYFPEPPCPRQEGCSWKRLFRTEDVKRYMSMIALFSKNLKESNQMNDWVHAQYKSSLPSAVKASAESAYQYVNSVYTAITASGLLSRMSSKAMSRADFVSKLGQILCQSSRHDYKRHSMNFISGKITSLLEDVLCFRGLGSDEGELFDGDCIHPGFGGDEGYSVFQKDVKPHPQRPECGSAESDIVAFREALHKHASTFLSYLTSLDNDDLETIGCFKRDGYVLVIYNWRRLKLHDVEHMWCKLYLLISRYRGTRAYSAPEPWRASCHPTRSADILDCDKAIHRIFGLAISNFEKLVNEEKIDMLQQPFVMFASTVSEDNLEEPSLEKDPVVELG